MRSVSPYQGPSGPSHPYQMYPQRTLSVATSTTAPVSERSYQGPQRPTHPYGLYTQTTESHPSGDVTIGFGRPDHYQRRIGPDGEEVADLIGPLGHTEELPPYTRYPEVSYAAKTAASSSNVSGTSQDTEAAETQAIPGAGGIGLATRNPEYESRDDLASPQSRSRLSTRSVTSEVVSSHEINTAAVAYNEKQEGTRWQKRAKKRMWGVIPYWAVCLVCAALLIMGIILGAVIGTLFTKETEDESQKPDEDAYPITTETTDVIPLLTRPTDLPSLELGTFSLPPLIQFQAPTTCFNDTSQAQAWTCNVPFTVYSMTVDRPQVPDPLQDYELRLYLSNNSSPSDLYTWGTQPPVIEEPIPLQLVEDTSQPDWGAAWFGTFMYNKTVIIAEDRFPNVGSSSSKRKRGYPFDPTDDFRRAGVIGAQVGDRPWICTWPGTMLEVFVYPYETNSLSKNTNSDSSSADGDSASDTTSSATSSPLSQVTQPPAGVPPPEASQSTTTATTSRTARVAAPPYPNVMKIEESRISDDDTQAAVCQQVEICEDGITSKPVLDSNNAPVEVIIVENQRSDAFRFVGPDERAARDVSRLLTRQEQEEFSRLSECGCMWWFT